MKKLIVTAIVLSAITAACKKEKDSDAYVVNSSNSVAEWKGSTSVTSNTGSFGIKSTSLSVSERNIKGGEFIIPIATVQNFNLPPDLVNTFLDHLKSKDFFYMAMYPNAKFTITKSESYSGNTPGTVAGANYLITGSFNMIGRTQTISFPANIQFTNDSLKVEATFKLDRSKWGMNYANDPVLGEHYIYPEVDIHLKVKAGKV